jgi:hypothetical protein
MYLGITWLVAQPETNQVWSDYTHILSQENPNDLAPKETPSWITVLKQDSGAGPFINEVNLMTIVLEDTTLIGQLLLQPFRQRWR